VHHIDLFHSSIYTGAPWLFATFVDLLVGGWLVDMLVKRGANSSSVRRAVLIGGTTFGLGVFGAAYAQTTIGALVWISLSIGGLSAASPVGWSIPSLIAPKESVGTLGGILNLGNQLSAIAAPIATGYIAQATHSFFWAFAAAAIFLAVGIAGYVFLLRRIETIAEPS
jgi:MFS family permease